MARHNTANQQTTVGGGVTALLISLLVVTVTVLSYASPVKSMPAYPDMPWGKRSLTTSLFTADEDNKEIASAKRTAYPDLPWGKMAGYPDMPWGKMAGYPDMSWSKRSV